MKTLILLSLLMSYLLTISNHPMAMIAVISSQTLIVCLFTLFASASAWFSLILFLVFMGGLMVLFIYISSLASNEKLNLNLWSSSSGSMFITLLVIMMVLLMNKQSNKTLMASPQDFIFKIYSGTLTPMTSMTMLFLLLALIIIVNITMLKEGPLRQLK